MKAFWALAALQWAPSLPSWEFGALLGEDGVARLSTAGLVRQVAIRPWERMRCPSCGMDGRVIWERGRALLICEGDLVCDPRDLGEAPYRLAVDAQHLARRLAAAFELEGAPGSGDLVIPLGRRYFGDERVAVDLCPYPNRAGTADALHRVVRGGPRVRVVLVPDSSRLRADAPSELAGVEIAWVGLDEVVVLDGGLRVDLRSLLARRAFTGMTTPKGFDGLVLDSAGVVWRGQRLVLSPRAVRLARVLAENPGGVWRREDLWRRLCPDDHTRTGQVARGVNPDHLDQRVRKAVLELRRALGDDLVANTTGRQDEGGYRLALTPDQVRAE